MRGSNVVSGVSLPASSLHHLQAPPPLPLKLTQTARLLGGCPDRRLRDYAAACPWAPVQTEPHCPFCLSRPQMPGSTGLGHEKAPLGSVDLPPLSVPDFAGGQ